MPGNVTVAVNLYQTATDPGDNRLVPEKSSSTIVWNVAIPGTTHTEIDDYLWPALASLLLDLYGVPQPAQTQPRHLGPILRTPPGDPTGQWALWVDGAPR